MGDGGDEVEDVEGVTRDDALPSRPVQFMEYEDGVPGVHVACKHTGAELSAY